MSVMSVTRVMGVMRMMSARSVMCVMRVMSHESVMRVLCGCDEDDESVMRMIEGDV